MVYADIGRVTLRRNWSGPPIGPNLDNQVAFFVRIGSEGAYLALLAARHDSLNARALKRDWRWRV